MSRLFGKITCILRGSARGLSVKTTINLFSKKFGNCSWGLYGKAFAMSKIHQNYSLDIFRVAK
jgi:hypothetical protein